MTNKKSIANYMPVTLRHECFSLHNPDPKYLLVSYNFIRGSHILCYKGVLYDSRTIKQEVKDVDIKNVVYTGIVISNLTTDCIIQTHGSIYLTSRDDIALFQFNDTHYGKIVSVGPPLTELNADTEFIIQQWTREKDDSLLRIGVVHKDHNPSRVTFRFFGPESVIVPNKYNFDDNSKKEITFLDDRFITIPVGIFIVYYKKDDDELDYLFIDPLNNVNEDEQEEHSKIFNIPGKCYYHNNHFQTELPPVGEIQNTVIAIFFHHTRKTSTTETFISATANDYKSPNHLRKNNNDFKGVLFICKNECIRTLPEDDAQ